MCLGMKLTNILKGLSDITAYSSIVVVYSTCFEGIDRLTDLSLCDVAKCQNNEQTHIDFCGPRDLDPGICIYGQTPHPGKYRATAGLPIAK